MRKKNLYKAEILRVGPGRFGAHFDEDSIKEFAFQLRSKHINIFSDESSVGKVIDVEEYDDYVSILFSSYFSPPIVPVYIGCIFTEKIANARSTEVTDFEIEKLILLTDKIYPAQPPILFMGFIEEIKGEDM